MPNSNRSFQRQFDAFFMPYVNKYKDRMKLENGRFVHYTSAENALNIFRSRRVWMRNARCMNDYMEVTHGHNLLLKFFHDHSHKQRFIEAFKPCENEAVQKALERFDKWWSNIEFNTFITSISEHETSEDSYGRLSMWRAYSHLSARAAIVLNIPLDPNPARNDLNIILSPVAYFDYQELVNEMNAYLDEVKANTSFLCSLEEPAITNLIFTMLVVATVTLKHKGFKEEKEWRVIYLPHLAPSELISNTIETINGVPQTVYHIPLEDKPTGDVTGLSIPKIFDRIIIGPSEYPHPMYQAFYISLKEAGVEDPHERIIFSGIPLRT